MKPFSEMQRNALHQHLRKHLAAKFVSTHLSPALQHRRQHLPDRAARRRHSAHRRRPRRPPCRSPPRREVPITARGGGTSPSGQSIGPGIVLDCSKYLNDILDLDPTAAVARVQPGVVLDQLNRAAGEHDLQFGPECRHASRANLGGMIGNNSAGSRSIVYGKTIDHVRRLNVILADGSRPTFGPLSPTSGRHRAQRQVAGGGRLSRRWPHRGRQRRRDPPPLSAYPSAGQRLQPRRPRRLPLSEPERWPRCRTLAASPACISFSSAAKVRSPSSPRRN